MLLVLFFLLRLRFVHAAVIINVVSLVDVNCVVNYIIIVSSSSETERENKRLRHRDREREYACV